MPHLALHVRRGWSALLGLTAALTSLSSTSALAQGLTEQEQAQQRAVPVTAVANAETPSLTFSWPADASATSYEVARRPLGATTWGPPMPILGGASATTWVDTSITPGSSYEYWFTKNGVPGGTGFLAAGVEADAIEQRGTVVLFVTADLVSELDWRLERLRRDLRGDGWTVAYHEVLAGTSASSLRTLVQAEAIAAPIGVESVFLLGDLPVPYSGDIAPDGHEPDHRGAWPCDLFFGERDGPWTDFAINTTAATRPQNHNVPGDGKYDQSSLPSDVDITVGRVDLSDMPAFAASEVELLRAYLDKNHAYRHGTLTFAARAIVDDNFGSFDDYIAYSAWRNLGSLLGPDNVTADDFFGALNQPGDGYLWAYGCGAGSYTSSNGIGSTADFVTSDNQNIFTVLFGSYYADWDSTDNFLRAPLCSGSTLASIWSGRPHWSFHPLALGETLGYCARMSQNSIEIAGDLLYARSVHTALMGDPTLRMHIVASPSDLLITDAWPQAELAWTESVAAVDGYHVYRAVGDNGPYTRLTSTPVVGGTFTDPAALAGPSSYMVRAVQLATTTGGSFWNLSQGAFASAFLPDQPAVHEEYGIGCYTISDSIYRELPTALAAASELPGTSMTFSPAAVTNAGDGYDVSLGAVTFLPPTVAAIPLTLDGDQQAAVALPSSFAYPGGLAPELHIHENGIVGFAALSTSASGQPEASALRNEPAPAFYSWHDFTADEAGSGPIVTEQVGDVFCVTWDAVESHPTTAANPSTLQFQFDLVSGDVHIVWLQVTDVGETGSEAHVIGWSPAGPSVDTGAIDVAFDLPASVGDQNRLPLRLTASPPAISTENDGTMVTYTVHEIPEAIPDSGIYFGLVLVSFTPYYAGLSLAFTGMPGCQLYVIETVDFLAFSGSGSTLSTQLWIPAGVPTGTEFFATGAALYEPFGLPNGRNAAGFVSSNGVRSFINDH